MSGSPDYTLTPNLGLYMPNYDADDGLWGTHLNANASTLDAAIGSLSVAVPPGGSIQAAHDALPATGGSILLAANTTYIVTAQINITKPNVHISAPSWGTILRRDPGFSTGGIINASGAGCAIEGFTVDGNSVVNTAYFEVGASGAGSVVRSMQIINSAGNGHLALGGNGSRATGNTITGLGTNLSTQRGYGIWANLGNTVTIDNNTVTGTCIDAIGFNGEGSRVSNNYVAGCHCYTGGQGGQIASYNTSSTPGTSVVISGNTVGPPGSTAQGTGIESWIPNTIISGNSIDGIGGAAITVFNKGAAITGNAIRNCGGGGVDAIVVVAGITDFVVSGNRIADEQTTPTMRYGVSIYAGASDRYTITGNLITGNTGAAIFDGGTGTNKTISNNQGNNDAALIKTGGTMSGSLNLAAGVTFNNVVASVPTDFTGGIGLFPGFGISHTTSRMNLIAPSTTGAVYFNVNATDIMSVWSDGLHMVKGFGVFGSTVPASKPVVTGAKGSNAALASLLTALAAYGLITDTTTA